jgi:hypothetical protein
MTAAPSTPESPSPPYRSKTLAAWLALLLGPLGVHRLYVHGLRDVLAWLHLPPTVLGLIGLERMWTLGQNDRLAQGLLPLLGLMISQGMLVAIVWGLAPDERWHARWNGGINGPASGWGAVIAAVLALLVGGAVLMGTIAFSIQRFFEWQMGV